MKARAFAAQCGKAMDAMRRAAESLEGEAEDTFLRREKIPYQTRQSTLPLL